MWHGAWLEASVTSAGTRWSGASAGACRVCRVCGCSRARPCLVDLGEHGDPACCARWQEDDGEWICSPCAGQAVRVEEGEVLW